MTSDELLQLFHDSGVPQIDGAPSLDYPTLVLIHGFGWPSEIWTKLLPFALQYNARLVLVNRRDYPGAAPYPERDRALLQSAASDNEEALAGLLAFMAERARELHDFLLDFARTNDIPAAQPAANRGGIVIAGWSLGAAWITALLANVASFPIQGDVRLHDYVRRVVLHDPAYHTLGYPSPPPPADVWNPFMDASLTKEEASAAFATWVSGYYSHGAGETLDQLQIRRPVANPAPTISALSDAERAWAHFSECDAALHFSALRCGLFGHLRKAALRLGIQDASSPAAKPRGEGTEDPLTSYSWFHEGAGPELQWPTVEVRHILCDRSVWEIYYGKWALQTELEEAHREGRRVREVTFVRLRGANHFSPWDSPEGTLQAFLVPSTIEMV